MLVRYGSRRLVGSSWRRGFGWAGLPSGLAHCQQGVRASLTSWAIGSHSSRDRCHSQIGQCGPTASLALLASSSVSWGNTPAPGGPPAGIAGIGPPGGRRQDGLGDASHQERCPMRRRTSGTGPENGPCGPAARFPGGCCPSVVSKKGAANHRRASPGLSGQGGRWGCLAHQIARLRPGLLSERPRRDRRPSPVQSWASSRGVIDRLFPAPVHGLLRCTPRRFIDRSHVLPRPKSRPLAGRCRRPHPVQSLPSCMPESTAVLGPIMAWR